LSGWAVWVTGLPGSGKSTLSEALVEKLNALGLKAYVLSIDGFRRVATPRPRYSEDERETVYGALVYTAYTLTVNDVNVIIDATANRRSYREKARNLIENFVEVYVKCPLKICVEREHSRTDLRDAPKNIYDKASVGESRTVPGVGVAYEQPLNPEVTVESDRLSPEKGADKVIKTLEDKELL
jgi:adenylylsulfate kinase